MGMKKIPYSAKLLLSLCWTEQCRYRLGFKRPELRGEAAVG